MKLSKNFHLVEFICPAIYNGWGDRSFIFIDPDLIRIAQELRDYFGKPVTINNWADGGQYAESGLREFNTGTGSKMSQHKFGRAIDCKIEGVHPEEARQHILANQDKWIGLGLTAIERDTPSWIHLDTRFTMSNDIVVLPFK